MPESRFIDLRAKLRRFIIGSLILLAAWPVWRLVSGFSIPSGSCRDNFTRADMLSLHNALDFYQLKTGSYPTTEQGLKALIEKPTIEPVPAKWQQTMRMEPLDPWKNPYVYKFPGSKDPTRPELISKGPDGIEGNEDDLSSQAP